MRAVGAELRGSYPWAAQSDATLATMAERQRPSCRSHRSAWLPGTAPW